ncbi:hypothetical protein LEN26_016782 [Aphanomyces euteiches]|nr:hypothetical protein LEN26_016782 [Aphanomyces euteiches]
MSVRAGRGKGKGPSKRELQDQLEAVQAQLAVLSELSNIVDSTAKPSTIRDTVATQPSTKETPQASDTNQNVQYTTSMVEILLELRYDTFGSKFLGTTSSSQRRVLWEKLRLKFNIIAQQNISLLSLKNKLDSLRREYTRLSTSLTSTGNDIESLPKFPAYWDSLVEHFGDKHGLGHVAFADDGNIEQNQNSSDSEDEKDTASDHK